jgi:chromosomal replication initiator protein
MNAESWLKSLSILKSRIPEQAYNTWFSSIRFVSGTKDRVILGVPSKFFKQYIIEQYGALLEQALAEFSGQRIDVDFVITGEDKAICAIDEDVSIVSKNTHPSNLIPKYSFENFVIGPQNRFAHAACMAVAETPAKAYNPLLIYGRTGLGKTHLMHAIGLCITKKDPDLNILLISCEQFTNQFIYAIQNKKLDFFREKYRGVDVLLLDDVHFVAGKDSTQEEFFHTFNALYESHKQIVLSSDRHPKDIASLEERLISRFSWGLVTDVQSPDLETRVAILRKKAEAGYIFIPDEVIFFIAEKIKTNIRVLEGSLIRVAAYASLIGKQVSIGLAKEVLKESIDDKEGESVSLEKIQKTVCQYFGISLTSLRKKNRQRSILFPRQVAMYLARSMTKSSLEDIGAMFGGKDHTTVIYSFNKISEDIQKNENIRILINKLSSNINS